MKKIATIFFLLTGFSINAIADHITGGEMYYTLTGVTAGQYQYAVTLKLYMRCNSGRQFNDPTSVSIFDRGTHARIKDLSVSLTSREVISLNNNNPCISNAPSVCYEVGYYQFSVTLPQNTNGYVLSSQVNFRVKGINNLTPDYGSIGATYTTEIPGTSQVANGPQNNSAHFVGSDLVLVCANNSFEYSFAAEDKDGDELQYTFCDAYVSGTTGSGNPPPPPPYESVPYGSGYNESAPLGNLVKINSKTGLITGVAPSAGIYVVTVCVQEVRNGKVIATQRKDLQISIAPCDIAAAVLDPEYTLCKDTKTLALTNGSTSPLIHTFEWEFINNSGHTLFNSSNSSVSYTFPDTGLYHIKLVINKGEQCPDSTESLVKVYPGFDPDFRYNGICFQKSTRFFDATKSPYGTVNSWSWDFGEPSTDNDESTIQNPTYDYPTQGTKGAQLIVTNSKGCRDTVSKEITISDKPPINLAFRDTLICTYDSVKLMVDGGGIFSWTPNQNITNTNIANPIVSPLSTTTYYVNLNSDGCINNDSVRIRVVDHVSLQAMNDTTICQGDPINLRVSSNALQYSWIPAEQLDNPSGSNPIALTNSTTTYQVTAAIGHCKAIDKIVVRTVPYPKAYAGNDTTICYNTAVQLSGVTDGISYQWSPTVSLSNQSTLSPVAKPITTTSYIFSAFDTLGCPKPGMDTILVTVLPKVRAFAGRDTSIVLHQQLQLNATGGVRYVWSPSINLSATDISNPTVVFNEESENIRYKVLVFNEANCEDSAFILVKVFTALPTVFVPTAFTPNNDGKNDILRPICVGIQHLDYFNIYNRWGQLVFSTNVSSKGWDGMVDGRKQSTDTFIWIVKGVDYKGEPYLQKGTVTLIQ